MCRFRKYNYFIRFYSYPPEKFSEEQKYLIECALTFFSLVKYNHFFVRIICYFLLKSPYGFEMKTVSLLTNYSYRQVRTIEKLSPTEFAEIYEEKPAGSGRSPSISPELAGEIAFWILNHQSDCPAMIAVYLKEQHLIEVSSRTVTRFLAKYGLNKILGQQTVEEELIGRTKFLGGWLLFPFILPLLGKLLPVFDETKRSSFCAVFLTIFFMSLFGIPRLFHLGDISDIGFALLTSRNVILSRTFIWHWVKSCPKSLVKAFYQESRPEVIVSGDEEMIISIDEHVITRWTKLYDMAGTLWPTRGKSGKADKVFYVYALGKKILLSCLPLPANKKLCYCMVMLIKELRQTYGIYRIRVILDAGACKGFPLAQMMNIPGVIFVVKGCRWPYLIEQWEAIPRAEFMRRVDPADRYHRNLSRPRRYIRVAETETKIKGCRRPLRTVLIYKPEDEKLKDRYIPIYTNDEVTNALDIIAQYRSRQNHEMVYRVMKHDLGLDAIPPSTSPGQDPQARRFYSKRLQFFGWIKAIVFNLVQAFKGTLKEPFAKMRLGTLVRKFFLRSGSISMTPENIIFQFDYFNSQNELIPYCENINTMGLSIPWLGDRKMVFRFSPRPKRVKIAPDWWQSFLSGFS